MSIQLFQSRPARASRISQPTQDFLSGLFAKRTSESERKKTGADLQRPAVLLLFLSALLWTVCPPAKAQRAIVSLKIMTGASARVVVEGTGAASSVWSFRDSYAGVLNLGSRVENFQLFDNTGAEISSRQIAPGQFQAARPASKFRYEMNLAPPVRTVDAAKVSWLNGERGLLMLRDLLPVLLTDPTAKGRDETKRETTAPALTVRLGLPQGWGEYSNQIGQTSGAVEVADPDAAVFAVGDQLRISKTAVAGITLSLVTAGPWAFTDSEAIELTAKILKAHYDVFRAAPVHNATLILFLSPQGGAPDRWSAETRGSSVTLLMGRLPSKVAALAQLSVPLAHELLHLWVPNGLALNGDYDWFYEGFTVYQAARIEVRLGQLTFAEFLSAMGRAYDGYVLAIDHDRWSLVEAAKRRWTVGESAVYSKSMVVAFLYDLKLRSLSHDKRSLDDVYRSLFHEHGVIDARSVGKDSGQEGDGNDAALKALAAYSGMQDFGKSLISSAASINLAEQLAPFGFTVESFGLRTRINVNSVLSRQQRDLLHDLGYNDEARAPRSKR
jgi:hypothetical protein